MKAEFTNTGEWQTERVLRQADGRWRYERENGGTRGAYQSFDGEARIISADEAFTTARRWGYEESTICKVAGLEGYATAEV